MKSFDLVDSASYGYRKVWEERKYLLRLALVPVLIKLVCMVVVFTLGYQTNYIRQGLITLPASIAEGWLLAQFLRTILLLERWPILLKTEPTGKIMEALLIRARGIMAATILYTLITFLAYGLKEIYSYFYTILDAADKTAAAHPDVAPNPLLFIPALALIYLSIWVFKFLWLYIPASVLMPIGSFLKQTTGFIAVLRMLGVFLVGMIPCFVVAIIFSNLLTAIVGGPDTDIGKFILVIISVLVEIFISLITTASMTYVFKDVLPHHPDAFPEVQKNKR